MPQIQWFIPILVLGVGFIVLGIILMVKASSDEGGYFSFLSTRPDVRKYLQHESLLAFISLKVGGRISLAVGVGLLILGFFLWRQGV
jgi:hypothetical protein